MIDGLLFGAIYAIAGVTFSIVYDITKVFHIAFGSICTLGVYVAVALAGEDGSIFHLVGSVLAGGMVSAAATALVVAAIYQPLVNRGADNGATFVSSLAVALLIQALVVLAFGPNNRSFPVDAFVRRHDVFGFGVSAFHVVGVALAVLVVAGLGLLLGRTTFGHQVRAIASNREQAELVGIRTKLMVPAACAIGGGFSVIAITLLGMNGAVVTTGGTQLALFAVLAAIAGGSGGIYATACVGAGLGILGGVSGALFPGEWSTTAVFAFALVLIVSRPFRYIGKLRSRRAAT